jgi:hypothetical protein
MTIRTICSSVALALSGLLAMTKATAQLAPLCVEKCRGLCPTYEEGCVCFCAR